MTVEESEQFSEGGVARRGAADDSFSGTECQTDSGVAGRLVDATNMFKDSTLEKARLTVLCVCVYILYTTEEPAPWP